MRRGHASPRPGVREHEDRVPDGRRRSRLPRRRGARHDGLRAGLVSVHLPFVRLREHHRGGTDRGGDVEINGHVIGSIGNAVPSFAEHLLVGELLAGEAESLTFTQFDEEDPTEISGAMLTREGTETVALQDGSLIAAERVQLTVGGRRTNTHWPSAGVVVKSDWCGAESYLSTAVAPLLDGLDGTVVTHIREFLDTAGLIPLGADRAHQRHH